MGSRRVITNYESLSALTAQMREAAESGEWERLIALEKQCRQHVVAMTRLDAATELDEPSRQRKIQLIKNILKNDADIRNRTAGWMGQLQQIIQSNRHEQRLQHTYGKV